MRNQTLIIAIFAAVAVSSAAAQEHTGISPIRKAAIEKLQKKLGQIRGSIKLKERRVFLTEKTIRRLKPVRPDKLVADPLTELAAYPVWSIDNDNDIETKTAESPVPAKPNQEKNVASRSSDEATDGPKPMIEENMTRSERLEQEILRAVGMKMNSRNVDDSIITNSTKTGTLPNTSNMSILLAAVERMIGTEF